MALPVDVESILQPLLDRANRNIASVEEKQGELSLLLDNGKVLSVLTAGELRVKIGGRQYNPTSPTDVETIVSLIKETTYTSAMAVSGIPITKKGHEVALFIPELVKLRRKKKKEKKEAVTAGVEVIRLTLKASEAEALEAKPGWEALKASGALIMKPLKRPPGATEDFFITLIDTTSDEWAAVNIKQFFDEIGSVDKAILTKVQERMSVKGSAVFHALELKGDEGATANELQRSGRADTIRDLAKFMKGYVKRGWVKLDSDTYTLTDRYYRDNDKAPHRSVDDAMRTKAAYKYIARRLRDERFDVVLLDRRGRNIIAVRATKDEIEELPGTWISVGKAIQLGRGRREETLSETYEEEVELILNDPEFKDLLRRAKVAQDSMYFGRAAFRASRVSGLSQTKARAILEELGLLEKEED